MNIAWIFPGQGSQTVGMARDVLESSPAAASIFARADEALGERLSKCIAEGPEETLMLTANAQPAILTTSIAILEAIRENFPSFPKPMFAAGHSLGEYSALVAAGSLRLEDAVRLVRARGEAMQEAVAPGTGAMAAVMGVEPEQLRAWCDDEAHGEVVGPANYNAPGQIVIAGHAGAIERVSRRISAEKGKVIPLKVSAPFHCSLMAPAAKVVAAALSKIEVSSPAFPIIANFSAAPTAEPNTIKDLLVRQVDGAVRWDDSIRHLEAAGVTHAFEIGPGKILAGLVKRITKAIEVKSISDRRSLEEVSGFFEARI